MISSMPFDRMPHGNTTVAMWPSILMVLQAMHPDLRTESDRVRVSYDEADPKLVSVVYLKTCNRNSCAGRELSQASSSPPMTEAIIAVSTVSGVDF